MCSLFFVKNRPQEEAATLRAQAAMERKKCEQLRSEIQVPGADREWKIRLEQLGTTLNNLEQLCVNYVFVWFSLLLDDFSILFSVCCFSISNILKIFNLCHLQGWLTQAYERCGPAKLAEMKKLTAIAKDA